MMLEPQSSIHRADSLDESPRDNDIFSYYGQLTLILAQSGVLLPYTPESENRPHPEFRTSVQASRN